MNRTVSQPRKLLAACLGAGIAVAASPASADVYEFSFATASQSAQIYFYAPAPSALPGQILGLVPNGTVIPAIDGGAPIYSTETTTGSSFNNSGMQQLVTGIIAAGIVVNQSSGLYNDNLLLSFVNSNNTTPPSSNLATTWFTDPTPGDNPGGFAFQAADGTTVDVYTYDAGTGPLLFADSIDVFGNVITASQVQGQLSTLTDLGSPAPTPGAGYLGLFGLSLAAVALKLRDRSAS